MWNEHFISDDAIMAMCNCHVPELLFIVLHQYIEVSRLVVFPQKYWYFNEQDNLLTLLLL